MQKFIISLKEKQTGRDVMPPYIVNSLDGLGDYSERVSPLGLIVIVDSVKEENNFIELKTQTNTLALVLSAISIASLRLIISPLQPITLTILFILLGIAI